MEIKIQCDCGQRFKLDVEPVGGVMPFAVACPICGVDGTQKGTDLIQQNLAQTSVEAAPPAIAPPPGKLKLSMAAASHAPALAPSPDAPATENGGATPAVIAAGRSGAFSAGTTADTEKKRAPNFGLGLLGGLGGALVGALLYYIIVKTTGIRLSYFAIGVGGLAGWMAELCGRGEGSKELAGITAACTVAFILLAQYFIFWGWWQAALGPDYNQPAYDREVKHAQLAVKMIPTGSDAEIRDFLAVDQAGSDGKPDPSAVSADDIKAFHDVLLPQYQDLASGKITREQFNSQNGVDSAKEKNAADTDNGTFKAFFILRLIRWSNLVSLAAAAGLAFRLSANA